ncbi:MAG: hypothetical protein RLY20_2777 [Verrucomicrobiota bacterium]|jgi:hypothetical protein
MNSTVEMLKQILKEGADSQAHQFLFIAIKWAVLSGLIGLFFGIISLVLFRKCGWYRSAWRFERWVRWPLYVLVPVACSSLLGSAGFFVGVIRGSEFVFKHSQIATKVFPEVGGAMADGVMIAQTWLQNTNAESHAKSNLTAVVTAFHDGAIEVNAPLFLEELDTLQSAAASNIVLEIEHEVVTRRPEFKSGLPNWLMHQSLNWSWRLTVERKLSSELKRRNLDDAYKAFRDRLVSSAKMKGNPDTISHADLSALLVDEVVEPAAMTPIRVFAGGQAKMLLFFSVLTAVIPAGLFRLTLGRVEAKPVVGATQ